MWSVVLDHSIESNEHLTSSDAPPIALMEWLRGYLPFSTPSLSDHISGLLQPDESSLGGF